MNNGGDLPSVLQYGAAAKVLTLGAAPTSPEDIAAKFNLDYGVELLVQPEPLVSKEAPRIMSLRDASAKMSKSNPSAQSVVKLIDSDSEIADKFRKAKTDPEPLQETLDELKGRLDMSRIHFTGWLLLDPLIATAVAVYILAISVKQVKQSLLELVDARLPDGSRVNVIIPPLALDGPCVSIRKFRREALTAEDNVTTAIYEAGYSAPSRFYETSNARLGMTPSAWRNGGPVMTSRCRSACISMRKPVGSGMRVCSCSRAAMPMCSTPPAGCAGGVIWG